MLPLETLASWMGVLAFIAILLRLSLDDVRVGMLYDRWVFCLAAVGLVLMLVCQRLTVSSALAGAVLGGGLLYFVRIASHGGMGGGDVKLAAALGIWTGLDGILIALFVAFLLGALCGLVRMVLSRGEVRQVPFGPFLAVGGLAGVFFREEIARWYAAWFW